MKFPERERLTAFLACVIGTLVGILTAQADFGLGNAVGAAILTYAAIVVGLALSLPLQLLKVLTATGKGALITSVVTAVVLIGIVRSFKGLV